MTNDMTDEARDAAFDRVKQATLDRILGTNHPTTGNDAPEVRVIDFRFGTKTCWMDNNRMTPNNDMAGIAEINRRNRENNGYIEL